MRRIIVGLALVAFPAASPAQRVRLDAHVSPSTVRVGDLAIVDVTVVTGGASAEFLDQPALPRGLRLAGSSDFSAYEFGTGGRTRTVRRELTIAALAPGRYVLPPMRVQVGAGVYRTTDLRIDVVAAYGRAPGAGSAPPIGPTETAAPGEDVLLQSWATPDTVFVGEQVTVRADALFSVDVRNRLAGAPHYEAPVGQGFWVYDLPVSDRSGYRPVRGRMYEVQTFRRAFFPLAAGHFILPGPRLTYAVRRGFLSGPETHEVHGDSSGVVVKPLPTTGRPADFEGAVGRYTAAARLETDTVSAGDAATLTVEVRGEGNIKAVPPPRLPTLPGVQVFPPAEDGDVRADEQAVGGVKRFSWVLIPSRPGLIAVPALELPFFDPGARRYVVARTAALDLKVTPAAAAGGAPVARVALRPIRLRDRGAGVAPWVHAPTFTALMTLPLLALVALVLEDRRRRRRAPGAVRPRGGPAMLERLRAELDVLRARAGAPDLCAGLLAEMRAWLADRLGAPSLATCAPAQLERALVGAGVVAPLAGEIAALARRVEEAVYMPGPVTATEREDWLNAAERLLGQVHTDAGRRRARKGVPLLVLGLLAAGFPMTVGAAQASPSASGGEQLVAPGAATRESGRGGPIVEGGAFGTGVAARGVRDAFAAGAAAYGRGQFGRASELLAGYVAAHPDHADAWYDLGSAEYRARHHGRAVWAWLRALELRPRDGDIRQNLAVAGVDASIVDAASPPGPLSRDELLLAAGVFWLVGAGLLLAWRLSGRRALAGAGATGVALAVVLATTAAFVGGGRIGAVVLAPSAIMGAPNSHADSLGQVSEGEVVEVRERRGNWSRVRAPALLDPTTGDRRGARDGWVDGTALGGL